MKKSILSMLACLLLMSMILSSCGSGKTDTETNETESFQASQESETEMETQKQPIAVPTGTKGQNPIITTIFTADPSAHVFGDKLYIYASHDVFPSRGCDLMDKYHVFSTTNMVDFADEGEILSSDSLDWGASGFMWAPDCTEKDGKYYFYYPHPESTENWNSTWRVGVAVSNYPDHGFVDQGMLENEDGSYVGQPDGTGNDYSSMIDPCVFKDTDGTYYLFVGGGSHLYYAKLDSDMTMLDGKLKEVPSEQCPDYHEGSWVFKRNDKYYLMYADNSSGGNCMRYCMADSVDGPWVDGGIFLDQVQDCDTTHGSIAEFKGQWYLFYHNAAISGNGTLRSVCIDKVEFEEDGSIKKVIQTKDGVDAVGERVAIDPSKTVISQMSDESATAIFTSVKTYKAASFEYGGGCGFNGTAIDNLHVGGSWFQVNHVDGGKGGKALVTVYYSTSDTCATSLVNTSGDPTGDGYFLAMRGNHSWSDYTAKSTVLVDLNAGTDNYIKFTCGMFGVNVAKITVAVVPAE